MRKKEKQVHLVIIMLSFLFVNASYANEELILKESTSSIVSKVFPKNALSNASKNEKLIKLRYENEMSHSTKDLIVIDRHAIKILLGKYSSKNARLLVVAESLGGPVSTEGAEKPVVLNSRINNLKYIVVRLPLGHPCKNSKYLVTVFLQDGEKLYWNKRKAVHPIADCGGF